MNHRIKIQTTWLAAGLLFFSDGTLRAGVAEETSEQVHPVGPSPRLTVKNGDGRIYVYGSDDHEIKVVATKRAFTKERLDEILVQVEVAGDSVAIDTIYPPASEDSLLADRSGTVEYTLLVPQNCIIEKLELANGEILIEGLRGSRVDARLGKGRLLLRSCFSKVDVAVEKGGLDVYYPWWEEVALSLKAEVTDGDLRVEVPGSAAFQLEAESVEGHVSQRFAGRDEQPEDQKVVNATIGDAPQAHLKLRTTSGNVRFEQGN